MIDKPKPSREQLDKELRQFCKDSKKLGEKIEMIGKRGKLGRDMTRDEFNALLVKVPFVLSSPPKDHYKTGKIEDLVGNMEIETKTK